MNRVLLAELVTKNSSITSAQCIADSIELRLALPCRLSLDVKDYTQGEFYFAGFPEFTVDLIYFANDDTLFYDIGANGGLVSLAMSHFLPQEQIFAFEPVRATFDRLKQIFSDNCPLANAANIAISSQNGFLKINVPDADSGSASASTDADVLSTIHGCETNVTVQEVECTTFDSFYTSQVAVRFPKMRRFAFKVDVEGHELEALNGMTEILSRDDVTILLVVEVRKEHGRDVHDFLSKVGMRSVNPLRSADRITGHHDDCHYVKMPTF